MKNNVYDVVIIGGGTAGLAAAKSAKAAGAERVCIVEEQYLGGGEAREAGMLAIMRSAELYDDVRREGARLGVHGKNLTFDLAHALKRKEAIVQTLFEKGKKHEQELKRLGIEVIYGRGSFADEHTIRIGARDRIVGKAFVIATGTQVPQPSFAVTDTVQVLKPTAVFSLQTLPASVVIIGSGAETCTAATYLAMLGVPVTILCADEHLLVDEDDEMMILLESLMRKHGVHVITNVRTLAARQDKKRALITYQEGKKPRKTIAVSLLVAESPLLPNIKNLDLDFAGIQLDASQNIPLSDLLLPSSPSHIFFAGSITGASTMTRSRYQGELAGWNATHVGKSRQQRLVSYHTLPRTLMTNPAYAAIGLTTKEANVQGKKFVTHRLLVNEGIRAASTGKREGMMKVLVEEGSDRILGAHLLCDRADDLIEQFVLAMERDILWKDVEQSIKKHLG